MAPFPPPILRLALSRFLHIFALNRKEKKNSVFVDGERFKGILNSKKVGLRKYREYVVQLFKKLSMQKFDIQEVYLFCTSIA